MRYKSAEDRAVDIAAIVIVALVAICCLYPIIYCFSMSLSGDDAIVKHAVTLLPVGLNLESYRMVLADPDFVTSFVNSVIYTVVGTAFSLFFNLTLGYVLSRKNFVFKKQLMVFVLIPMFFSGGLIPSYMLIKSLGLYNTMWAIIAILTLYSAVGYWNDYFSALIYLKDEAMQPLQLYLRNVLSAQATSSSLSGMLDATDYISNYVNSERIKYVLIVVSTLPIVVVYPFIQKYFVKGVMLGSVKG